MSLYPIDSQEHITISEDNLKFMIHSISSSFLKKSKCHTKSFFQTTQMVFSCLSEFVTSGLALLKVTHLFQIYVVRTSLFSCFCKRVGKNINSFAYKNRVTEYEEKYLYKLLKRTLFASISPQKNYTV